MDATRRSARCLCGEVRLEADLTKTEVGACHCAFCRRWAGGPFMVVDGAENVVVSKGEALGVYQSSDWGERGFCTRCGSSLFWRSRDGAHFAVSANAFDDLPEPAFTQEIFIDSKPDYYAFANDTRKMTGAELFAEFASGKGDGNG